MAKLVFKNVKLRNYYFGWDLKWEKDLGFI